MSRQGAEKRRRELGLKWEDIDFVNQTLRVRRQVGRINGEVREAPLKTKNAYRTISLGTDAVGILKQQREKQPSSYIFPCPSGAEESRRNHGCLAGGIAESYFY